MSSGLHKCLVRLNLPRPCGVKLSMPFGGVHVIDVLRGAKIKKASERGHDQLECFGTGEGHAKEYWHAFIRQAVAGNYLIINIQKFGALQLTRKAQLLLSGNENFLHKIIDIQKSGRAVEKAKAEKRQVADADKDLLASLKALRLKLARERNAQAFVIFHDTTLIEMAHQRPPTLEKMASINGVGPRKLEQFGKAFLEVVAAH